MVRWLPAIALPSNAQDADRDGLDDAQEQAIADANAPVLYFHPQEAYFPTSVQFAFSNSVLERYQSNGPPIRIDNSPTASGIAAFNVQADPATNPDDVYYLNNTKGTYLNDSAIRTTYAEGNYPRV